MKGLELGTGHYLWRGGGGGKKKRGVTGIFDLSEGGMLFFLTKGEAMIGKLTTLLLDTTTKLMQTPN